MKKDDDTLYYELTALPGSDLEKAVFAYLKERDQRRKEIQDDYNRRVEKQMQKHVRGGL